MCVFYLKRVKPSSFILNNARNEVLKTASTIVSFIIGIHHIEL